MVLMLLLLAFPARSALIYYPTGSSDSIGSTLTDWDQNWVFGQFDPALGTLLAVHFSVGTTMTGTFCAENRSSKGVTNVLLGMDTTVTLTRDTTLLSSGVESWDTNFTAARFDGTADYSGPDSQRWTDVYATNYWTTNITDAGELAYYVGTSNVTVVGAASGSTDSHGSGNIGFRTTNSASGNFNVWYEYSAASGVPEPSTWLVPWALLGLGVLTGVARRLRKPAASGTQKRT